MTSIRNEGQEVRHSGRASRSENLKETVAPAGLDTTPTAPMAQDRVHLPAKRDDGPLRGLPDLSSWGENLAEAAVGVANTVAEGGKKAWDNVSQALGLADDKPKPAQKDGTEPAAGQAGADASVKTDQSGSAELKPADGEASAASAGAGAGNAAGTGPALQAGEAEQTGAPEGAEKPKGPQLQGLPPRPEDARGGKEFMESIKNLKPGPERDKAILDEIMKGNIPDNLRDLKEVNVQRKGKDGQSHDLTMHVMPDYLSVGSNEDNVRIPMTPAVAQAIADKTGTSLPTDRMADDIHSQSKKLHLDPFQWKPGNQHARNMQSVDHYQMHDQRIDAQLGTGEAQSELVSGHKKDLVIPNKDGRVAIYGGTWPGTDKRVQPYSNLHESSYEDYSHGARLVSQDVVIDGKTMKLSDVLADPNLAPLVTRFPPGKNGDPAGLSNRYDVPERLQ